MSNPTRKEVGEFLHNWDGEYVIPPLLVAQWDEKAIEIAEAYLRTKKTVTQLRTSRRKDREAMLAAEWQLVHGENSEKARMVALATLRARLEES